MNIVLLEPEMPANTGNIGRTCVATGTKLHLIKPLGFEITDKMVKRAGLDYWPHLNYEVYENFEDFLEKNPDCIGKLYMATTKARHIYTEVAYEPDSYLMFGKESAGIPEEILVKYEDYCMRIPMEYNIRSLNLSNSVAIVLYEALRQHQFAQMELQGHLVKWLLGTARPILLIPACFLGGSVFCLFCDLLARTMFSPTELSISTVTAVFGAPVVIYIMIHRRREKAA